MAVTVSKQFKEDYKVVEQSWRDQGDTEEQIAELKDAIRIDLSDGEGFLRDPEYLLPDPVERRKLWEDYFHEEANRIRAIGSRAAGCHSRIVNDLRTKKAKEAR